MFKAASLFLKPYLGWIVGGAVALVVGAFSWLVADLALTKAALSDAASKNKLQAMTIRAQERGLEAVNRIDELEQNINRMLRESSQRIMDAEGADNEISQDVAAIWAATDDSLRAQRTGGDPGSAEGLPNP